MPDLFKLLGTIAIESNGAQGEIDNITSSAKNLAAQLGATDKTAGKSVGKSSKLGAGAIWLGNTATTITNWVGRTVSKLPGMMVESAAEMSARTAAFSSTFGQMADEATQRYKEIGEETNILETRLRSVGTKGFSQLKGTGLEAADALAESEKLLRMSADAAAYYDISLEDADTRIRSFMRGNTEAGDMIGLFTSETQRNSAALETYGQKWLDLTEAQKQLLMLNIAEGIYESNGVIGQAVRESAEYANVMANTAEAGTQVMATLGGPMKDSMIPFMDRLSNWLANEDTQSKLGLFADKLGKISSFTFDNATKFFDWMLNNGEAVGAGLGVIAAGLAAGAIAAHPFAAAVLAVAAGLTWLASAQETSVNAFSAYTQEEIELLNQYHEAVKKAQQAREDYANADGFDKAALWDAQALADANVSDILSKIMMRTNGNEMMRTYNDWFSSEENAMQLSIPVSVSEESEGNVQSEVSGWDLESLASIYASPNSNALLQGYLDRLNLTAKVKLVPTGLTGLKGLIPGFASGIDRVPHDMLAVIHKDETILNATAASKWRGENKKQNEYASRTRANNRVTDVPSVTQYITVAKNEDFETGVRNALEMLRWQG